MNPQTKFGKMFPFRSSEPNPEVIVRIESERGDDAFRTSTVAGWFYRVMPSTAKEIFAIQNLEMYKDKFAPAKENGILISAAAMAIFDA